MTHKLVQAQNDPFAALTNEKGTSPIAIKGGSLTFEQLHVACRNIGYDLTCSECACVFYTGTGGNPHASTCKTLQGWQGKSITRASATNEAELKLDGGITLRLYPYPYSTEFECLSVFGPCRDDGMELILSVAERQKLCAMLAGPTPRVE